MCTWHTLTHTPRLSIDNICGYHMLSVVTSASNDVYVLFVQGDIHSGLEVKVTNGSELFFHEGLIRDETHRPQSRSRESKLSYMTALYTAFTSSSTAAPTAEQRFVYDFQSTGEPSSLQLLIKERVANSDAMSILFRGQFLRRYTATQALHGFASNGPMVELLQELEKVVRDKHDTIAQLSRENAEYQSLNNQYTQDIQMLAKLKDSLQDSMIQRMCVILNSKKLEIQRLQDRIEELEGRIDSTGVSRTEVAAPVSSSSSARPAASRGRRKAADSSPPSKPSNRRGTTRSSADVIQKKAQQKTKQTTRTGKAATSRRSKKQQDSDEEDEEEEEEDEEDRAFIASENSDESGDDNGDEDEEANSSDDGRSQQSESPLTSRKSRATRAGGTASFLTQRPSSLEVDSANILNFLSQKNIETTAPLSSLAKESSNKPSLEEDRDFADAGTTRGKKRSTAAFLSQDSDFEDHPSSSRSRPTVTANARQDEILPKAAPPDVTIDRPVAVPVTLPTTSTAPAAAAAPAPAPKKKRSERFLDSDDDDDDGCLSFL